MPESIRGPGSFVNTCRRVTTYVGRRIMLPTMESPEWLPMDTDQHDEPPRVSFQGAPGAFSELAIQKGWPRGAVPVAQPTFDDAVDCALRDDADFAIIPVENAIAGPVHAALQVLDRLDHRLQRCGGLQLNVQMCLMALPGTELSSVNVVLSHPMALAQCRRFFSEHPQLAPVVHGDTATAARDIAREQWRHAAAIASAAAASRYGLDIIAESIQDRRDNWTRFVILKARPSETSGEQPVY